MSSPTISTDRVLDLLAKSGATLDKAELLALLKGDDDSESVESPIVDDGEPAGIVMSPVRFTPKAADAPRTVLSPIDLGIEAPKIAATKRQQNSAQKGARWYTHRGRPQPCYIDVNKRDADQPGDEKVIKVGERGVYWPMVAKDGTASALFFHGKCWSGDPQFAAASGCPLADPEPVTVITVKQAKARDAQGKPKADQLPGGAPRPRTEVEIYADTIKEAAIARAYAPRPSKIKSMIDDMSGVASFGAQHGLGPQETIGFFLEMAKGFKAITNILEEPARKPQESVDEQG